jgi:hypothetical protein
VTPEEKILDPTGTRTLTLGYPAGRQSLYRLRYRGTLIHKEYDVLNIKFQAVMRMSKRLNETALTS